MGAVEWSANAAERAGPTATRAGSSAAFPPVTTGKCQRQGRAQPAKGLAGLGLEFSVDPAGSGGEPMGNSMYCAVHSTVCIQLFSRVLCPRCAGCRIVRRRDFAAPMPAGQA